MTIFEAIILGIIQGLTEFIPISSSGHVLLAQNVFLGASDHLFLEYINIGTVAALIIYFWPRLWQIVVSAFTKSDWRLVRNLVVSAIPAGVIGLAFAGAIETNRFFGSPWTVAATLLIFGVVMVVLEKIPRLPQVADGSSMGSGRAAIIGFAQVLALVPGTSRSASTIVAGRLSGLSPAVAAEYSFLLSIPIMLGLIAKLLVKSGDRAYLFDHLPAVFWGNLMALVFGLLSVKFLMGYLKNHSLQAFGWYRIGLAVLVALTLTLG